jgi:thiol-disulfide isomerase/thioredoxin
MKKSVLFLLVFLTAIGSVLAQGKGVKTKISGKIINADKEYYMMRHRDNLDTLFVDGNGAFAVNIMLAQAEECKIIVGKGMVKMYVLPGDEAYIELYADKPASPPTYGGKSTVYSNLFTEISKNETRYSRNVHPKVMNPVSPARALAVEDSILALRIAFVEKYCTDNKLESAFRDYHVEAMKYLSLSELCNYKKSSPNYSADSLKSERPAFDAALTRLPIDNIKMLYSDYYQQYVRSYISGIAGFAMVFDGPEDYPEYYDRQIAEALRSLKNEEVKNYMIKELAIEAMRETGTRDISKFMSTFEKNCSNELMRTRVMKIWSTYASIQPGATCPEIECYDSNGKTIRLADLKGKALYIDVWATWCGPCKREIPMLKELEAAYHGKDIEFVSISTDKDVEAWKAFVVKESLGGLQVHQSENFDFTISKHFIVNSIPRFILIDAEGKIVSADAPRPSSGTVIRTLIDSTLAKKG